ncbi:GNAT family N-acetyltransferase [Nocardia thailandica]
MTSAREITVRPATGADRTAIDVLQETSFGMRMSEAEKRYRAALFPADRSLVALDGDRVVGHTVDITMTVTVPGGRAVPASGVSGVVVAPTHRRRGILRRLFAAQHARTEADGLPLTIFTATEGTIYGRFGYDTAIVATSVAVDRRRAEFRAGVPDPGGVEIREPAEAQPHIRAVYERWRQRVPGAQARPSSQWELSFADLERRRGGASALFALVHPDGYALYRRRYDEHRAAAPVWECRALTPDAHAALWRVLLGLDLVDVVEAEIADDDPLPYLLTDPRAVRVTGRKDSLWARVMAVPAALTARTYAADLDTVIEVADPFGPAGGTFALRIRDGVASCAPTARPARLRTGVDTLAALYFGAHRARDLAAGHRIAVEDPRALRDLDGAFAVDRAPERGWFF